MYTTKNALVLATSASKSARKAADITESPHRTFNAEEENWPALMPSEPVPSTPTETSRSQRNSKRGKTSDNENTPASTQRKLHAFFELAKQPIIASPPKLASLGNTRNTSSASAKIGDKDLHDNDPIIVETTGTNIEGAKGREDPPAKGKPSDSTDDKDSDEDDEYVPPLSNIKLRPKSKLTPAKSSLNKPRKQTRQTVASTGTKVNLVVEPEEAPPLPVKIKHPFRTVVTATVRLDKVKDTLTNFVNKLMGTISFLWAQVDDTIAIVPKSKDEDFDHIIDKASFPRVVYKLNQRYFNIETRGAFTDASKTQSGRTVKLSLVLGSTVVIDHQLLEEIRYDTQELNVTFWYKPHQEVDTVSRIVFLGAPNNANKNEIAEIINDTLQPLEKHLVDTDPSIYKPEIFNQPWPKFAIVSEQPTGQPYTKPELGPDGKPILKAFTPPPSERRSLHIMCNRKDYSRLATLVMVAKAKNMWLKVFGMCYPVEAPDQSYSTQQGQEYLKMVDVHESAQISYGTCRISGVIDPSKQSVLRREIGEPITVSVRQIMRMITTPRIIIDGKVKPGEQVWLCVLLSDNGAYTGYYAGPNKKHQSFASTFSKCPAAQIYFFLCRHGVLQQDVDKFIRSNFSMAQLRLVSQAKYNRKTGLATVPVQPGEENILDAARLDNSLVDLTKLTKREFEEDEDETEEYKGPKKNDLDCYKFGSTQSVTTINHGAEKLKIPSSGKTVKSVAFGESVCSIDTQDDMQEDEDDENAAALALDPISKLRNEVVQFDLSFMEGKVKTPEEDFVEVDKDNESSAADGAPEDLPSVESVSVEQSETVQLLENQRKLAATDAALAAATVGLDLSSVTDEDDNRELSFAILLASDGRTFQEMYDILDSLLEENLTADKTQVEDLRAKHIHVPGNIRLLLTSEAEANGESEFDLVVRIRNWLLQAEDEEAKEAGEEHHRDREYDTDGSVLPRPEEFGDGEPQGCGASLITTRTNVANASQSADSSTARLGAKTT